MQTKQPAENAAQICSFSAQVTAPQTAAPCAAYVYMVQCADGSLYSGWTTDVPKRVAAHNAGRGAKYTKSRRPVRLVYAEACADKSTALRRECALKALPRAEKLKLCGEDSTGNAAKSL